MKALPAALLLALAVIVPHWPRAHAEFVYDDRDFVEVNQSIRSFGEAFAAWLSPFPPDQPERGLYRPLTSLSYALDYRLGGGDARAFHRSNVLLYGAVVALVYCLALAWGRSSGFALALALLFAVHPVHCDVVDAIAGRSELLALLFSLAALLAFLRARPARGSPRHPRAGAWLAASAAATALACAAKETGAVLPAVLAVHAWVLPRDPQARREALRDLLASAGVLALYLAVRLVALGGFTPAASLLRGASLEVRLHTLGSVFLEYLRLLVFPRWLEIDFYYQQAVGIATGPTLRSWIGLALCAAAAGTLAWLLLRARRTPAALGPQRSLVTIGLAIFLGFWLPVSHVLDFGALMAERFLFAPSLGFLLLALLAGEWLLARAFAEPRPRRAAGVLCIGLLALVGGVRSAGRATEWRDATALWQAADRDLPDNPAILSNLAGVHISRGEIDAASALLERGLARHPDHVELLGNLGNLRLAQGRFDDARAAYERLLELAPTDVVTWNNLGVLETRRGRVAEALPYFRHALELDPNYADARRNLEAAERSLARQ